MTDGQIEKGLELCVKNNRYPKKNWCKECPYLIQKVDCIGRIEKDALAYINRLKAEKAVSDRALEGALSEIYDLTTKYNPELIIPYEVTKEQFVNSGMTAYKNHAKQVLAKEKR